MYFSDCESSNAAGLCSETSEANNASTDSDEEERADELVFNRAAEVLRDAELIRIQLGRTASQAEGELEESDSDSDGCGDSYGQAWNSFNSNPKFMSRGRSPTIRACRSSELPRRGVHNARRQL